MAEIVQRHEEETTLVHRVANKADKLKYLILALVVVVIASVVFFSHQRRQQAERETRAKNAIYQAEIDLMNSPESDAVTIFGDLAKEYQGLPAGASALVIKFGHAFGTRKYEAAEEAARDYLQHYGTSTLANRARLSLGQALLMQDKTTEAASTFRELVASGHPEILPEAKLALAQTLERQAEEAKDDPDEYRRRLEAAEAEYNDIVVRSQISVPSQRGFWPQSVTLPADFALVVIKDKLAGYQHQAPRNPETPVSQSELESAALVTAPPADVPAQAVEEEVPVPPPAEPEAE